MLVKQNSSTPDLHVMNCHNLRQGWLDSSGKLSQFFSGGWTIPQHWVHFFKAGWTVPENVIHCPLKTGTCHTIPSPFRNELVRHSSSTWMKETNNTRKSGWNSYSGQQFQLKLVSRFLMFIVFRPGIYEFSDKREIDVGEEIEKQYSGSYELYLYLDKHKWQCL